MGLDITLFKMTKEITDMFLLNIDNKCIRQYTDYTHIETQKILDDSNIFIDNNISNYIVIDRYLGLSHIEITYVENTTINQKLVKLFELYSIPQNSHRKEKKYDKRFDAVCLDLFNKSFKISTNNTKCVELKGVHVLEIGYQRKGIKDYSFLHGVNTLFSKQSEIENIYANFVSDGYKEFFKENILDKFIEGETLLDFNF